jgi:hypothetical protein
VGNLLGPERCYVGGLRAAGGGEGCVGPCCAVEAVEGGVVALFALISTV